jgi:hypothetical protein
MMSLRPLSIFVFATVLLASGCGKIPTTPSAQPLAQAAYTATGEPELLGVSAIAKLYPTGQVVSNNGVNLNLEHREISVPNAPARRQPSRTLASPSPQRKADR